MTEAVLVAVIGAVGAIIVEIIRRERAQRRTDATLDAVLGQMSPNSGKSMHDAVTEIRADVRDIKVTQREQGERLSAVEARVSDHLSRS